MERNIHEVASYKVQFHIPFEVNDKLVHNFYLRGLSDFRRTVHLYLDVKGLECTKECHSGPAPVNTLILFLDVANQDAILLDDVPLICNIKLIISIEKYIK